MSERTARERPIELNGHKFIRLKSGRLLTFWDALSAFERGHTAMVRGMSRALKLATDEYDLERLEWKLDHLESYTVAVREHLTEIRSIRTKHQRISLLRNTSGRTPEEAELYRRKADELEAELVS